MSNLTNLSSISIIKFIDLMFLFSLSISVPAQSRNSTSFRGALGLGAAKLHRTSKANNSKFLTGLAVGSLVAAQKNSATSYNGAVNFSSDDKLYVEYVRNNELLKHGNLSRKMKIILKRRNQQIKNILVKKAELQYIAAFTLQCIPLKEQVVETKSGKVSGWVGLGWVGLGWVGLGWVGLGWVGLGWVGLGWGRLCSTNSKRNNAWTRFLK